MVNKRRRVVVAILLVLALGNYVRLFHDSIRWVEFLSVFVMGALTGVLLIDLVQPVSKKDEE